jgi:DNA helicase II / ATP-dependent DNA helicase PcrA
LENQHLYNDLFLASLSSLNEAQTLAVEHIEGPVLVLAGPGTGKTHILASRIGNILLKTDAQAHNILCLTYTDAGSVAMRQRLLQLIGPEAHKVHVFTYHSFCAQVIKSHSEFFGKSDLDALNKLEKVSIIRALLDELPSDHLLINGRSDYFYEKHLSDIFDLIKKENWTIDYIERSITLYINDLPQRQEFYYKRKTANFAAGAFRQREFDEEVAKMALLKEAVLLFPKYQKKMEQAGLFDFNDMISWVIKAFQENENLLRNYQEQYLYFLVDEFQDTNGAQYNIVKLLTDFWESPNVFIVGDDDQAIYEFQGARLQSFVEFYEKYQQDIEVVVLKENYRSTQAILDASRDLIGTNNLRIINTFEHLHFDKNLVAANQKIKPYSHLPIVVAYPNDLHELVDIVAQLEKAHQNGKNLNEIAVLYAQNKQADDFIHLLEKKGIPYSIRRSIDILQETVIQQVISILQYLSQETRQPLSGDALLFQILHFRCWKIPARVIAQLSFALQKSETIAWRTALSNHEFFFQNEIEEVEKLTSVMLLLEECIEDSQEINIATLVEKIVNRSGILTQVIESEQSTQGVQMLATFFDFIKEENTKHSAFSLHALTETLEKMLANDISLDMQRTIVRNDGVFFSTVHSAKGLEFKRVYIIGCHKKNWENYTGTNQWKFSLPDTLTLTKEQDLLEARRRLFYVGMTRAKTELYLSYSKENNDKLRERSLFIEELIRQKKVEWIEKSVEKSLLLSHSISALQQKKVILPAFQEGFIAQKLEHFALSASSMIAYLDCPLSFYFDTILGVPSQVSEFATYGNVLHKTLQLFFDKCVFGNKKQCLDESVLLAFFQKEIEYKRHVFSKKAYQLRLENGMKVLQLFYQKEIKSWRFNGQVESYISNTEINGVPVKGTIDKVLNLENGSVEIIDYKTTTLKSEHFSKKIESGKYRKQLLFYKLLYENWRNASRPVSQATISYLVPDFQGDFAHKTLIFEADEVTEFRQLIRTVYDKITQQEFHEGCGKPDCHWCTFTKKHVLPNSTYNPVLADVDDV